MCQGWLISKGGPFSEEKWERGGWGHGGKVGKGAGSQEGRGKL